MAIEMEEADPPRRTGPQHSARTGRLWVRFADGEMAGPAFGPFAELDAEPWILQVRDGRGTERVLARRLDEPDELGGVAWELDDDVDHPGEHWPRYTVSLTRPATEACAQCVERAGKPWNPSSEIRNADAYRALVRWASVYGLSLYPDASVDAAIFAPLRRRRGRPEVANEIRGGFGRLKTYSNDEIIDAVSGNSSAVFVTAVRQAQKTPLRLLPDLPSGAWVARIQTSGLLVPGAAGVVLAQKRGKGFARGAVTFLDPPVEDRLVIGVVDQSELLVLTERRLRDLELLGEVLRRPVPRGSFRSLEDLLPSDGPSLVGALERTFTSDGALKEIVPGDYLDTDDLPWLGRESAQLIKAYGLGKYLRRATSAVDGEIAVLGAPAVGPITAALDEAGVAWTRSDKRLNAVSAALGAG